MGGKNARLTVYLLLADKFDDLFIKAAGGLGFGGLSEGQLQDF